jgi:DEAD/DEAH box helicase domain-containing protein
MKNKIVLDLETKNSFEDVGGRNLDLLKISVVGVYDYSVNEYITFEEDELERLEEMLKRADLLIGFNINRFDIPVLQPYVSFPLSQVPVLDIMEDVVGALGYRLSLENLSRATLQKGKSGHGLEAVRLFREGKMEELKSYCLDDVRLTRELYEYGQKKGYLSYTSRRVQYAQTFPVKWPSV